MPSMTRRRLVRTGDGLKRHAMATVPGIASIPPIGRHE